jgi:hypothetical protein
MNLCSTPFASKADGPRVPVERLSHPKDDASARQPKAERAPDSAVVRPQAAGKSRSLSLPIFRRFVSCGAGKAVIAAATLPERSAAENSTGSAGHFRSRCVAMVSLEHDEGCWFKPTRREKFACFLAQDRLCASDVLHRDWDWSGWL